MITDKLIEVLSSIHPISEEFRTAIEKELTHLSLPKHYHLVEAAKNSDYAYFLNDGFAMSYTFVNGKKQIDRFWKSGQIIVSSKSFFERVPSKDFIQLLEMSSVFIINYESVMKLLENFPEANFILRVVMNQYQEFSHEQLRDIQDLNSTQRYKKLITRFPGIEQSVAQEYIASYLSITPQSLSRIKRTKSST